MAKVEIYTKATCPFCVRAKALLREHGASYEETDVQKHPDRRPEMIQRANGKTTVPQIFIDGQHVGGCDQLEALDRSGKLKPMLEAG